MFGLQNGPGQESQEFAHHCFFQKARERWREINIARPATEPQETLRTPKKWTDADKRNIVRLEELSRGLKENPREGMTHFRDIYGPEMSPYEKYGWSADSFSQLGLHPELGNPAYYGHKTIKGVVFLDVDDTQSNQKHWTPQSALDRALFIIELAQKGTVVVPVTGSPMTGGDPGFGIDCRLENGELFPTHLLFTSGGSEGYALEGNTYDLMAGYQRDVQRQTDAYVGRWKDIHEIFMTVAEEVFQEKLGDRWAFDRDNLAEFNHLGIAAQRFVESVEKIQFATDSAYKPYSEAEQSGGVAYYLTLPSDTKRFWSVLDAIGEKLQANLDKAGLGGLTCFPGYVSSFGVGEHVAQGSIEVSASSKQAALLGFKQFEARYGIPLDAFATISFGGDGPNDPFFVPNFEQVIKEQAPGLLTPRGVFLIQTSEIQERIAESVRTLGWPDDRIVVLSDSDGHLWCDRLRRGLSKTLAHGD